LDQDEKWFRASLRIAGEELRPEEVSDLLNLRPTKTRLRGESVSPKARLLMTQSLWLLESGLSNDRGAPEHLNCLLDLLEPRALEIRALSGNFCVEFFCGFSSGNGQGGFTLDAVTLKRMADLGIALALDLYPPESMKPTGAAEG
jgi:hypothetical protein